MEGNKFRKWLCHSMPDKAIQLNIDSAGDYQNGHTCMLIMYMENYIILEIDQPLN